jgi:hypothetical protein
MLSSHQNCHIIVVVNLSDNFIFWSLQLSLVYSNTQVIMTSWLSSTFLDTLDTLGFGPGSSQPKPQKCKHSEDEHGRTKVRRQGEAASLKAQRQSESAYPKTPTKKRDSGVVVDKPSELNVAESDGGDKPRRTSRENTLPIQTEALEPQFMDEAIETDANPPIASPPDVQPFLAKSSRVFTKSQAPMNKANTLSKPVSPKAKTVTLDPVIGYDTDWKQGIATEQEWAMRPDKRALELALGSKNPKRSIMHEVQEPEYVLRDTEIRDGLWQLMDSMERLDEEFLDYGTGFKFRMPTSFFEKFSAETVKVISRVASGGPGGVQGWHDLFLDNHNRRALSMAIIGNVLVEQVFQHLFFGGSVRHVQKLTMLQAEYRHEDGKSPIPPVVPKSIILTRNHRLRPQQTLRNHPPLHPHHQQHTHIPHPPSQLRQPH